MSRTSQSRGNCLFCGYETTKGSMARHLEKCPQRQAAIAAAGSGKSAPEALHYLIVENPYLKEFWLHLEMRSSATLEKLDSYLRAIWLECCGHLSQFSIGPWGGVTVGKARKVEAALPPGATLTHVYDFGSTTETMIRCVSVRHGKPLTGKPIVLLARNKIPDSVCAECDAPATHYCVECLTEENEWVTLCDDCLPEHGHDDDYGPPIALVNSPRLGVCGYDGPAEPPY